MKTNRKMIKIQKKEKTITIKKQHKKQTNNNWISTFTSTCLSTKYKMYFFRLDAFFFWGGVKGAAISSNIGAPPPKKSWVRPCC